VLKIWDPNDIEGEPQVRQGIMPHHEVLLRLDAMDLDRGTFVGDHFFLLTLSSFFFEGAKVAGHRGYYLINDGIDLNQALISYGLDFLRKRGFKKIQPPFFMNKEQMSKTAQLDQFDEELYKVNIQGERPEMRTHDAPGHWF